MSRALKVTRWVIITLFLLFLLFVLSGAFITYFYGKEVTRYILSEISKNVKVEIRVAQVENLSFLQKFPFASMTLYDVLIKETLPKKEEKDTLLYLKKVYLQFNIIDIFQSDYKIKRVSVADGFVRLKVDENGKENYLVASSSEASDDDFLLKLSRMNISNADIFYLNALKEQEFAVHCNEAVLKGNFSGKEFLMDMEGDFFTYLLKTEDVEFLSQRSIEIKTILDINKSKGIYSLKKGEIAIDKNIGFEISGNISEKEKATLTDLNVTGKDLDIASFIELLPPGYRNSFSDYESKGNITFDCNVSGEWSNEQTPAITAAFSIDKGVMKQKSTSYTLSSIRMKGSYSNGKRRNPSSTVIDIQECSAVLGAGESAEADGKFEAAFRIRNMNNPRIKLTAAGKFNLDKLEKFIAIDTLENISGIADFSIKYEGAFKSGEEYTAQDFRNSKTSGEINFQEVSFTFKQSPLAYIGFSGNLILQNNDVLIKEMKGKVSSSDFELSGLFRNALAYLFLPREKLTVEAAFNSGNLDLNELLAEKETRNDTSYLLAFPGRVNFNLNADIAHLSFRKFSAADLSGIVTISDNTLRSKDIFFKTMEGFVKGTLEIDASSGNAILISSHAEIEHIDISRLFRDFENFGQAIITDKHLKGTAAADIRFAMMMDSALRVDENKIQSLIDLTIDKGELIGFEPMRDISGFIKNHVFLKRVIKADEFETKLEHIRFSTLKNQIQISDRKIIIPAMTINSSAMNIEAEGSHTFDNILDYKINFFLSELLTKREDLSQEEFGDIEDDPNSTVGGKKKIFLTIKGNLDDPVITYDKKKVKEKLSQEAQQEKKTVKGVLKEEFGWFKKDTAIYKKKEEKKDDFVIEWEEKKAGSSGGLQPADSLLKVKKENNVKKLINRLGMEEKKPEEDFELEKGEDF